MYINCFCFVLLFSIKKGYENRRDRSANKPELTMELKPSNSSVKSDIVDGIQQSKSSLLKSATDTRPKRSNQYARPHANCEATQSIASMSSDEQTNQKYSTKSASESNGTVALIQFRVGDVVWCKLKGFPKWPAKIKEICDQNNNYITIVWFNDYRITKVHRGQLAEFKNVPDAILSKTKKNVRLEKAVKEAMIYYRSTVSTD